MLNAIHKPALWLLIIIIGLPQLSETVYTPSLPEIGSFFSTSAEMMEYTLSIYLLGFGVGTLFWGIISDRIGRRPCMLMGLFLYLLGSFLCALSKSIEALLFARFVQACGGSVGSVLGQAICRDVFQGSERSKVFASIGAALSFAPAIGPIIGGMIAESLGWIWVFYTLTLFGAVILAISFFKLPETHQAATNHQEITLPRLALIMLRDRHVATLGFLVGAANGIVFSYYGEGSFYLIDLLNLTPSQYGMSFLFIAAVGMLGAKYAKVLATKNMKAEKIIMRGIMTCVCGSCCFAVLALADYIHVAHKQASILATLSCMGIIMFSMGLMLPTTLAIALEKYKHAVGRASSLFGFYYYLIVSLVTYGMGELRDGSLKVMPIYFALISLAVLVLFSVGMRERVLITSAKEAA